MASLRRALASGAFAARALYLDPLGHQLRCPARYTHLQYAVLKPGAYLTLLDVVGQNKASPEEPSLCSSALRSPIIVRTRSWSVISTSSRLTPGSSARMSRSPPSCTTSSAGTH